MRRAATILSGLALLAAGCTKTEQNPFLVRVSSMNQGGPLQADVIKVDRDTGATSIPEDVIVAEFTNKVYSPGVTTSPTVFWYDFHLKSYTVRWRRADGGATSGPGWTLSDFDYTAATSAVIPTNSTVGVGVLLGPAAMKIVNPFSALAFGGGEGVIPLIADIVFVGTPAIEPDHEINVYGSLSVNFADYGDEE